MLALARDLATDQQPFRAQIYTEQTPSSLLFMLYVE